MVETAEGLMGRDRTGAGRTVVLADAAGFCFGVRRAVEMAERARDTVIGPITTIGDLVHNSEVIGRLRESGVESAQRVGEVDRGMVILSAHGSAPIVLREARDRGLEILDVTCPFVTKVHRAATSLVQQGYPVLLVGDPGHTEVTGVIGAVKELGGTIYVVSSPEETVDLPLGKRVGIVSQTTQRTESFARVVGEVCRRVPDVRAINTVCGATEELQAAAARLAKQVDLVLVVGGVRSANTRRLRQRCEENGVPAYQIESASEIDAAWLEGHDTIGITAGASTPDWLIEDVARAVNGGELPVDWKIRNPDEK
jgi:4-hydroxy-3-methylbut-2-enyl diphosphate reductase